MDGGNLPIEVIGFPRISSAMPSGSTIGSHSAFVKSKTCLPSEVFPSQTRPFDAGASSLGRTRLDLYGGNRAIWHVDAVFITMRGERHYLWRAVDQDGDVIDILVTKRRDCRAAKRFFRKALKHQGPVPRQLVPDKLRTYQAAPREVFPSVGRRTGRNENNRAEVSPQHTREQEKQRRRFKSPPQAQRFLSLQGVIQNLFRFGRHHLKAVHYRLLRGRAFSDWREAICV